MEVREVKQRSHHIPGVNQERGTRTGQHPDGGGGSEPLPLPGRLPRPREQLPEGRLPLTVREEHAGNAEARGAQAADTCEDDGQLWCYRQGLQKTPVRTDSDVYSTISINRPSRINNPRQHRSVKTNTVTSK